MAIRTPTRAQPNGWIGSGEGSAIRTGREEVWAQVRGTPTRAQTNVWIGLGEGSAIRTGREEVGPGQRNSHQGAAQRLDRFRGG